MFSKADADWTLDRVKSGLSSGEGLIWAVRDPVEKQQAVKEQGKTTGYEMVQWISTEAAPVLLKEGRWWQVGDSTSVQGPPHGR